MPVWIVCTLSGLHCIAQFILCFKLVAGHNGTIRPARAATAVWLPFVCKYHPLVWGPAVCGTLSLSIVCCSTDSRPRSNGGGGGALPGHVPVKHCSSNGFDLHLIDSMNGERMQIQCTSHSQVSYSLSLRHVLFDFLKPTLPFSETVVAYSLAGFVVTATAQLASQRIHRQQQQQQHYS